MAKDSKKKELLSTPKFWGIIFFGLIPLFALIYTFLPDSWFGYGDNQSLLSNFWTSLYFSTITITTLGFGDIYPIVFGAKILVIIESLLGILSIGLFLNAVALTKSRLDVNAEKVRTAEKYKNYETIKLIRQYVVVEPYLKNFIDYATIVSTPILMRKGNYKYNPDFDFHDLYDLYQPTLRLFEDHNESSISYFYKSLHKLEERLEIMLRSVDISLWPELENKMLKVLRIFREKDFEASILGLEKCKLGNNPATKYQSELIKNWQDEIKYYPSNAINSAVALYFLIRTTVPLLQEINEEVIIINNSI